MQAVCVCKPHARNDTSYRTGVREVFPRQYLDRGEEDASVEGEHARHGGNLAEAFSEMGLVKTGSLPVVETPAWEK